MSIHQAIRLSDLTTSIRNTLQQTFAGQTYWVKADVTSYSWYGQRGVHYFDLVEKDEQGTGIIARVSAVAWGSGAQQIRAFELITGQQFRNNIHVLVLVAVSYHQVHGLQVNVLDVDINYTIGQLEQQKQQILQRLLQENPDAIRMEGERYITRNQELALSPVIQQIAVVTSGNSAGYQDFHHTLVNNSFGYTFKLDTYFTVVQGEANAELVQQRMVEVFSAGKAYDAVVIIRGGGAQTDFLLFDSYQLGRVVARFPIPVITGIGHQKNETVADMMAHTATKTPTKAAEFIIAHNRQYEDQIIQMQQQILIRSQQIIAADNRELHVLQSNIAHNVRSILERNKEELLHARHSISAGAQQVLQEQKQQLQYFVSGLTSRPRAILQHEENKLQQQQLLFRMLDPESIIRRGFALIYKEDSLLKRAEDATPGDPITIRMQDATLRAIVQSKITKDE
ncbi:MAG: exodeoxyribonuclease VII large subunit [Chitinophaga sp.]|uniref:exodeoxyribonuclease VII large subunit n=1 Tax=Chitinophaga sp. TaxID=1869181 RepID=UPI0025B90720|nr:exodeoxyribonuclease VII large subunit [Chitinophaga sp.]MBV8252144.1 exodeoxyribonuclease VII large subunit [Chitinophaga sp.]